MWRPPAEHGPCERCGEPGTRQRQNTAGIKQMRWDDLSREDLVKLIDVDALVWCTVRSPDGFKHPVCSINQHRRRIAKDYSDIVVINRKVRYCPDLRSQVFRLCLRRSIYDRTSRGEELKRLLLGWNVPVVCWEQSNDPL